MNEYQLPQRPETSTCCALLGTFTDTARVCRVTHSWLSQPPWCGLPCWLPKRSSRNRKGQQDDEGDPRYDARHELGHHLWNSPTKQLRSPSPFPIISTKSLNPNYHPRCSNSSYGTFRSLNWHPVVPALVTPARTLSSLLSPHRTVRPERFPKTPLR